MSNESKHTIEQLLREASQFNANDVLVHCENASILPVDWLSLALSMDFSPFKALLATAEKTYKERGVYPLCIARGTIEWDVKQKRVRTPLLLIPCTVERNKVTDSVRFIVDETMAFVNPFLVSRLEKEWGILVPNHHQNLTEIAQFLVEHSFSVVNEHPCFVGNFHHHRFQLIKELEELLQQPLSDSLRQLLGDESVAHPHVELGKGLLFPADNDQLAVFASLEQCNTVIQGPPGTGKSHVLGNVLGKLLEETKSALVVSEKRVALEVLHDKLGEVGLNDVCFIATSETLSKDFLQALNASWLRLERREKSTPKPPIHLSVDHKEELQHYLRMLNQPGLVGGMSVAAFIVFTKAIPFDTYTYSSDLPDMLVWQAQKNAVEVVYKKQLAELVGTITRAKWQQHSFAGFDQQLKECLANLHHLRHYFQLDTWIDVQQAMRIAALSQYFNTAAFRKHEKVLTPTSSEQKRFIRLRKMYLRLHIELEALEKEEDAWKIQPTQEELLQLKAMSENHSLWGRFLFKQKWNIFSRLPVAFSRDRLSQQQVLAKKRAEMRQIKQDFYTLGIENIDYELESIHHHIHLFTPSDYQEWQEISAEKRDVLSGLNAPIHQLYTQLSAFFRLDDASPVEQILLAALNNFEALLSLQKSVQQLDESLLRGFKHYTDFKALQAAICKSNWMRFTVQFPQFSSFNIADLLEKCRVISRLMSEESEQLSQYILAMQQQRFDAYHTLLQTPTAKLSTTDKQLKAELKRGKALLVKEFSKSRSHRSIRELMVSEARAWIQLLKPIWLSNPSQLAHCFPVEADLFDCALLDEASQLILQHGLGAVQRAKRILVAGDQQQMGPSSYFSAQQENPLDFLHQASFYWKNCTLTHHYRSEHPALIRFSNTHFYGNKLLTFPSKHQENQPIQWHYVEKGRFEERKNNEEARQVAAFVEEQLTLRETIGIVAFSETQLSAIYDHLSVRAKQRLEERIEENSLFFKALENVQGEECDRLIISLGYGHNEQGEFHHRFGPINGKNGTRRLNVLLTRARRKVDFFSSIRANDFKISSNEGVNLLRLFLQQAENTFENQAVVFPYNLTVKTEGNRLMLDEFYTVLQDANELITYVTVLEKRGWAIEFLGQGYFS